MSTPLSGNRMKNREERMIDEHEIRLKRKMTESGKREYISNCITVLTLLLYGNASCGTGICS